MVKFTLKSFLTVAVMGVAATTLSAQSEPAFVWADYLQSSAGTIQQSVAAGADGASYWMGNASTGTAGQLDVTLNNNTLFQGEEKVGTAATSNFVLFKANADGTPAWNIHSTAGDYTATKMGSVVEMGDNVYFNVTVRQYSANVKSNLVDATGKVWEFGDVVAEVANRYYVGLVVSATKEGAINWITVVDVEHDATKKDGLAMQGLSATADGKIVVVGTASFALTVPGAAEAITPAAANQAFVMLFDAEGKYAGHFFQGAEPASTAGFGSIKTDGTDFYFAGTFTSPTKAAITTSFGGKEVKTGGAATPFVAKASYASLADGKFDWLTTFPTEPKDTKSGFNDVHATPGADCVWLTGGFVGKMTVGSETLESTQTAQREGFIVKIAADGTPGKFALSRTAFSENYISVYEGALQSADFSEVVYAFGYGMNAAVGMYLRKYDANTLEPVEGSAWTLATFSGMPTAGPHAYVPEDGTLFAYLRPNKAVTAMGEAQSQTIAQWTSFCAKYTLPADLKSGLENVAVAAENVTVTAVEGGIEVTSTTATTVAVYDIAGRTVAVVAVGADAPATVYLPAGMYIAAGAKVAVK